jgi:hypothetical protein
MLVHLEVDLFYLSELINVVLNQKAVEENDYATKDND